MRQLCGTGDQRCIWVPVTAFLSQAKGRKNQSYALADSFVIDAIELSDVDGGKILNWITTGASPLADRFVTAIPLSPFSHFYYIFQK